MPKQVTVSDKISLTCTAALYTVGSAEKSVTINV